MVDYSAFSSGLAGGAAFGQSLTDSKLAQQQMDMQQAQFRVSQRANRLTLDLAKDERKRETALRNISAAKYGLQMQLEDPKAWGTLKNSNPQLATQLQASIKSSMDLGLAANATDDRERKFDGFDPMPGADGNPDPERVAVRMKIREPDGSMREAHMSERGSSDPDDPIVGVSLQELLTDADSIERMIMGLDTEAVSLGSTAPIETYEAEQAALAERQIANQDWRRDRVGARQDARYEASLEPEETYTVGTGETIFGESGDVIAQGPPETPESYTLGSGDIRIGANGQVVARGMKEPAESDTREFERGAFTITEEQQPDGSWAQLSKAPRWEPKGGGGGADTGEVTLKNGQLITLDDLNQIYKERYGDAEQRATIGSKAPTLEQFYNGMVTPESDPFMGKGAIKLPKYNMQQATDRASQEADDRSGFFGLTGKGFGNKSREQWVTSRAKEIAGNGLARKAPAQSRVGDSPYDEGSRLRGPDGKMYEVRIGKPVLIQ